jgi:hypothetical protein
MKSQGDTGVITVVGNLLHTVVSAGTAGYRKNKQKRIKPPRRNLILVRQLH